MSSLSVKIRLIEDDQNFQERFIKTLENACEGVCFCIDTCNGEAFCSDYKSPLPSYDIYVCSKSGKSPQSLVDFVKTIKERDGNASIFIVSDTKDSVLLKKLMKLNVTGFIDRNDLDLSPLCEEAKITAEAYAKVSQMVQKLNRLKSVG